MATARNHFNKAQIATAIGDSIEALSSTGVLIGIGMALAAFGVDSEYEEVESMCVAIQNQPIGQSTW